MQDLYRAELRPQEAVLVQVLFGWSLLGRQLMRRIPKSLLRQLRVQGSRFQHLGNLLRSTRYSRCQNFERKTVAKFLSELRAFSDAKRF